MGHACTPPTRTGARRSAAVHPASCYSCAVAQGVRTRGRRHKCCCYEGAGEAEMSSLAASGAVPIIRYVKFALGYTIPVHIACPLLCSPVDHIYYNKYNSGWDCK